MKLRNYTLLLPILTVAAISAYMSYEFLGDIALSKRLNSDINKHFLLKNMTRAVILEHKAELDYSSDASAENMRILEKDRAFADKVVLELKNSAQKSNQTDKLVKKIQSLRQNSKQEHQLYMNSFFYFFERINSVVAGDLSLMNEISDPQSKIYITTLDLIHSDLNALNASLYHISQALQNGETISGKNVKKDLAPTSADTFGAGLLPQESKAHISELLSAKQSADTHELNELRSKAFSDDGYEISQQDMPTLDDLEQEKFMLLLDISDVVAKDLQARNEVFSTQAYYKFSLAVLIAFGLLCCAILLAKRLKELESIGSKIRYVQEEILKQERCDYAQTLQNFINFNKEILGKYERIGTFNKIKNSYLMRLNKALKSKYKQNLQSLAFLRKTYASSDQIKAIDILEENSASVSLNFENIKNVIDIENSDLELKVVNFDPQITFKSVLESKTSDMTDKKINFVTYIDPSLNSMLEGDESKIKTAVSNLIIGALYQCNPYANIIVEIKDQTNNVQSGVTSLCVSVKNNADAMSKEQIDALLDADEDHEKNANELELYINIANMYLGLMDSHLAIDSTQGVGNEFRFVLKLARKEKIEILRYDKKLKIGFVLDTNAEYNAFIAKMLNDLGIKFESISNLKNLSEPQKYDTILMRESKNAPSGLKNLTVIKDPLTPIRLLQKLSNNASPGYSQKFIITKPQILICSTNALGLEMLAYAFELYSVELTLKSGYDELADTLKNKHFDLIFTDMSLCKDDITHFANKFKKLKHTTQNAQTKTIGIVSNTSDVSMRQVMENFDECVKKPIDTRALTTLLDKFIPNFKNFVIRECVLIKNEDIILCKKSDIENKIFGAALGEFGKNLSIAKGFGELISKMNEKPFGLILVDESVADFDMDALLGIVETFRERFSVDARMLVFSDKSYQSHAKSYIKALSPHISKIELANVIKNELNDIGKAQL
ncbi:sensor histidine kinase [Campylobacter curvus]|uniref:sensor histidine kinase n=1 Tax=Campylobacter curvus TaxID=200 RepID=UPI00146FFF20|nr:ATP-binding protein [Campylobacter curvus]